MQTVLLLSILVIPRKFPFSWVNQTCNKVPSSKRFVEWLITGVLILLSKQIRSKEVVQHSLAGKITLATIL